MGKGSTPRQGRDDQAFRDNYDNIFKKQTKKKVTKDGQKTDNSKDG